MNAVLFKKNGIFLFLMKRGFHAGWHELYCLKN